MLKKIKLTTASSHFESDCRCVHSKQVCKVTTQIHTTPEEIRALCSLHRLTVTEECLNPWAVIKFDIFKDRLAMHRYPASGWCFDNVAVRWATLILLQWCITACGAPV